MDKIKVAFQAGPGFGTNAVNFMLARVEVGDEQIELYAELEMPEGDYPPDTWDDEHYPILKEEIIRQAKENGIDPEILEFWWD